MSDRTSSGDEQQRANGADEGREGFGDDGGTRVGRPSPGTGADRHTGPSTEPVKEGLEGAIFEEGGERRSEAGSGGGSTGAGAEAAEGTHNAMRPRAPGESSGVDAAADQLGDADSSRRGSEPLTGRTQEHVSGYGGAGGKPKTSSDQRE